MDARTGLRAYCSADCSRSSCPEGFECVAALGDQHVCVAPGAARCDDHVMDKFEECDVGGAAPLECEACKTKPASFRSGRIHAVWTGYKADVTFDLTTSQKSVPLPYTATWAKPGTKNPTVNGVSEVTLTGEGVAVWVHAYNGATGSTGDLGVALPLKGKSGHLRAVDALVDDSNETVTCVIDPAGTVDITASGKRTYHVDFNFARVCTFKGGGSWEKSTVDGEFDVVLAP